MKRAMQHRVWERAGGLCAYCRISQMYDELPLQIDHIIAKQHGGFTQFANLSLACAACNKFKGPNLAGIDRKSGNIVRLFHPNRDKWRRHFRWKGPVLIGRTAIGRATVSVLQINLSYRVRHREQLIAEGVFPPD